MFAIWIICYFDTLFFFGIKLYLVSQTCASFQLCSYFSWMFRLTLGLNTYWLVLSATFKSQRPLPLLLATFGLLFQGSLSNPSVWFKTVNFFDAKLSRYILLYAFCTLLSSCQRQDETIEPSSIFSVQLLKDFSGCAKIEQCSLKKVCLCIFTMRPTH